MSKDLKFTTASEYMEENAYTPDYWTIVKITTPQDELIYKVFATWRGSYTMNEAWRMNSGITNVEIEGNYIKFYGNSGSVYKLVNKESEYRTTAYTQSILEHMKKGLEKLNGTIEELPFDTNWEELIV
jgi:hypothetical protein